MKPQNSSSHRCVVYVSVQSIIPFFLNIESCVLHFTEPFYSVHGAFVISCDELCEAAPSGEGAASAHCTPPANDKSPGGLGAW